MTESMAAGSAGEGTAAAGRPPLLAVLRDLVLVAVVLGGVGCTAIGVSGLVAAGMGATLGRPFVAGSAPGVTYSAERCAAFQRGSAPGADCETAATDHHFEEVVAYRLFAGVLGLLTLGALVLVRRAASDVVAVRVLPASVPAAAGAGVFGGAAVLLTLPSLSMALFGVPGAGNLLSAGLVSAVLFVWYSWRLVRALRAG